MIKSGIIVLLKCCATPRLLQIPSTTAINYSDFREKVAIGALKFRRILSEFENLFSFYLATIFLMLH